MKKHILLCLMIICYLLPIGYVYYNYNSNKSVSNIICDDTCKYYILFFMGLMGIVTLLYELERDDIYSQILISILLIGIYGLISINETNAGHYVFASLVFISILLFMARHCYLSEYNIILLSSILIALIALCMIIVNMNHDIFYGEIMYILNFAFFYLYLHFLQNKFDITDTV